MVSILPPKDLRFDSWLRVNIWVPGWIPCPSQGMIKRQPIAVSSLSHWCVSLFSLSLPFLPLAFPLKINGTVRFPNNQESSFLDSVTSGTVQNLSSKLSYAWSHSLQSWPHSILPLPLPAALSSGIGYRKMN